MKQLFNDNRLFAKAAAGISPEEAAGHEFHAVDIPHDRLIYDSNRLYETSCGVYRRTLSYNGEDSVQLYFGGFVFTPRLGAYQFTGAADADLDHGDSSEISGGSVLGIGNNVTLEFEDMDFSKGVSALEITGRTRHDNDSVHVHLTGKSIVREIVEFGGSDEVRTVRAPPV